MQDTDIAWSNDRNHLYGNYRPVNWNSIPSERGGTNTSASAVNSAVVPINQNQHFMVWMRPSATPAVRKLWGVIRQPLLKGACGVRL